MYVCIYIYIFIGGGRPINRWFKKVPKEEGNTEEGKVSLVRSGKRISFADPVEEHILKSPHTYIIPAKNPNREGLAFLVRTYVEFMVTF